MFRVVDEERVRAKKCLKLTEARRVSMTIARYDSLPPLFRTTTANDERQRKCKARQAIQSLRSP